MANATNSSSGGEEYLPAWQNCEQMEKHLGALYNISMIGLWLAFTFNSFMVGNALRDHVVKKLERTRGGGYKLDMKTWIYTL